MKIFKWIAPLLLVTAFLSCDPCKKTECLNGGVCWQGDCLCNAPWRGENCSDRIPCSADNCINGICASDTCLCVLGYEGWDCATRISDRYEGLWSCDQDCSSGANSGYICEIYNSETDPAQFFFDNIFNLRLFWGISTPVYAFVDSSNAFTIPLQTVSNGTTSITIEGQGGRANVAGASYGTTLFVQRDGGATDSCVVYFSPI